MNHQPFIGTILELKYGEIYLFDDLGIFLTDKPVVCRMDVADLEEVMAEVSFWVYSGLGNIFCTWPGLGHVWGENKCGDLWQVCYQYCTDMCMYELTTFLYGTEFFKQLYADWKTEFHIMPGDTFDEVFPGGDEWVVSYVQSHTHGLDEDLYVPIIPMQERSLLMRKESQPDDETHSFAWIFGLHGPHSAAVVYFGDDVDFASFEVDASALPYNGVYRVIRGWENTGRWDQSGVKRYVIKDSESITTFTTSHFDFGYTRRGSLADNVILQPPTNK